MPLVSISNSSSESDYKNYLKTLITEHSKGSENSGLKTLCKASDRSSIKSDKSVYPQSNEYLASVVSEQHGPKSSRPSLLLNKESASLESCQRSVDLESLKKKLGTIILSLVVSCVSVFDEADVFFGHDRELVLTSKFIPHKPLGPATGQRYE
ncbi:hypothetical protein O9G_005428 [Rozella allomycis CSF55]|uniref:Uncharacterized protein n=1 Tax=Rozella allomycis (strain CSF55) TaxID=988480 RepID=A0A075AT21_ROZAC|nr:hypothetical protein O9G_005428 [Rozella allomycis CSF55]|eukprot:EPZ33431.1 hypothetical protein O9G_005428 [Rozella allomycis CSF55]